MRDSPETLEWYEECIQRNIQVHAQIPLDHQPSIVHCHTGRRIIITPAKRAQQRKLSSTKSTTTMNQLPENVITFNNDLIEHVNSLPISTTQTVNILRLFLSFYRLI